MLGSLDEQMTPHFRPVIEHARVSSPSNNLDAVMVEDGRHMHLFVVPAGEISNNCYPLLVLIGYEPQGCKMEWLEESKLKIEGCYQDFSVLSDIRITEGQGGLEITFDLDVVCK